MDKEQASLLGGAPDLLARVAALRAASDEASPVWAMDFSSRDGQDAVFIRPKPNIPPQQVEVELAVVEGDAAGERVAQDVAAAFDYGAGAVIEPGHITRVDNEALAALKLPWDKVGMVLRPACWQ
ncbi:hypothetical protein [Nocardia sp. NRRL S-836]|uniref:hypothetical protein n=1 Tax=Nocardia sp. NRRL S-836 TaxID=1519492 RepID=UPI0006AE9B5D|nr:hypothetical protein [Nocardia sp. NRRL S-836]KOV87594.1 hypothetical protein ADL03_06790 [Nocardia sp. NRRL S-836]